MVTFEYPFANQYLDLGGLSYHYIDEGKRDGEAVLMLHGNPSWSYLYRNLVRFLAGAGFRCIAPDHIGCGRSDKPGDEDYDYTLARRVQDLDALIAALDLDRINLVAHDWGGMIGLAWATQNSKRVSRLVLMNTAAFPLPKEKSLPLSLALARTPVLGAFLVRTLGAFAKAANRYCVTRGTMPPAVAAGYLEPYDSYGNRIALHRFVQDIPLKPGDASYQILERTAASLSSLAHLPMLLCWGMRDFVFDRHFLQEWVRRFPGAEVHRFEDAGHYVLEDAGQEIHPIVRKFLEEPR